MTIRLSRSALQEIQQMAEARCLADICRQLIQNPERITKLIDARQAAFNFADALPDKPEPKKAFAAPEFRRKKKEIA